MPQCLWHVPVCDDMLYQCDVECFITTDPLADYEPPLDPLLDRDRQVQGGKGQFASDLVLTHVSETQENVSVCF